MKTIRLGRTNTQVSAVSLGTWGHGGPNMSGEASVGWSGNDDSEATAALIRAYELGIRHWDTADVYGRGHAEELIGAVWGRVARKDIFLATKVGWEKGEFDHAYHPKLMERQLAASLRNLRTDSVDLYYFHHCDFGENGQYFDDALATMQRFREQGKFRFLGLSDWDSSKIMRFIDRADPDVVQPYRNVVDDQYVSSGLQNWIDQHDVGVAFFSPLRHGLLLGKYAQAILFPEGDFRRGVEGFNDPAVIARMQVARAAVENRFRDHPEPVLHALTGALLADAPTGCVLLGQRNTKQVEAAGKLGEALSLGEAEWVRTTYESKT